MRCVLLSSTLDLASHFAPTLASIADRIEFIPDPVETDPAGVAMALAWKPAPGSYARYPGLKAVCSIGAGIDNLLASPDLPAGVDVVRVVDPAQARMMSGFVLWHVIGHQRRFADYAANQRAQVWCRIGQRQTRDVPVAILGYGKIGRQVGADLAHLGFPVLAWSRGPRATSEAGEETVRHFHGAAGLSEMLPQAEVLVNLLPLTAETRGILDSALFGRMRRGGFLVQVGRGDHLVEADLLAALADGTLSAAALDVASPEPLPSGHPFWTHPRITVTPHDACDITGQALAATLAATAEAIQAGRRPPNAADPTRGY